MAYQIIHKPSISRFHGLQRSLHSFKKDPPKRQDKAQSVCPSLKNLVEQCFGFSHRSGLYYFPAVKGTLQVHEDIGVLTR